MITDAPARRLLAALVDEQAIETEPIADVRADLAALGIDSARVAAFARRLAAGVTSPAGALLGRIAEAEQDDDEIAGLARAEAETVRQRVGEGIAAAAIANAQRSAGGRSNVAALPRRRSRRMFYGLGGLAVALAASVVFYIGLSPDRLRHEAREKAADLQTATGATQTVKIESGFADAPTSPAAQERRGSIADTGVRALPAEPTDADTATAPQSTEGLTDNLQARMEPSGEGQAPSTGPAASIPASPRQSAEAETTSQATAEADEYRTAAQTAAKPVGPEESADTEAPASERADAELEHVVTGIPLQPQSQAADAAAQTTTSATSITLGEANTQQLRGGLLANQVAAPFGIDRPIAALLIVEPKLVPSDLKQQNYPIGKLSGRLADARRLAGNRPIAALVTLRLADGTADAIVVAAAPAEAAERSLSIAPSTSPASAGEGYDLILLERR